MKDWYTTEEVAKILGKAEFTVREWCRNGRVKAEKRMSGRGAFSTWVISHQELLRYQREGLLPTLSADRQRIANILPTAIAYLKPVQTDNASLTLVAAGCPVSDLAAVAAAAVYNYLCEQPSAAAMRR